MSDDVVGSDRDVIGTELDSYPECCGDRRVVGGDTDPVAFKSGRTCECIDLDPTSCAIADDVVSDDGPHHLVLVPDIDLPIGCIRRRRHAGQVSPDKVPDDAVVLGRVAVRNLDA